MITALGSAASLAKNRHLIIFIGQFDLLIGATARHYGLTVVTDNLKDFSPMPGVKIENWVERPSNE